jgi:hypothetical protein
MTVQSLEWYRQSRDSRRTPKGARKAVPARARELSSGENKKTPPGGRVAYDCELLGIYGATFKRNASVPPLWLVTGPFPKSVVPLQLPPTNTLPALSAATPNPWLFPL